MERENKYLVLKHKDIEELLESAMKIELLCADEYCFSLDIDGTTINVTAECTQNTGFLQYEILTNDD